MTKTDIVKKYCKRKNIPFINIKLSKIPYPSLLDMVRLNYNHWKCECNAHHWLHWIKDGIKFKYPLCCILFFVITPRTLWRRYKFITNKDGYVPCPIHRFILFNKYGISNENFRRLFKQSVIIENL